MPVLKIKTDNGWAELGGTSPADGGNADTLDGKHALEFALSSDVEDLQTKVGDTSVSEQIESALANFSSGKTLTQHLAEEDMILSSRQYGDKLPGEDGEPYTHVPGRIFFLKVSE